MTACVDNNQKKGGAAKAVSATLAGVLAVGMVPAVALADPGDSVEAEGDIELLVADPSEAFADGSVTAAVDNTGATLALNDISFTYDGKAHYAVPTEFTPKASDPIDLTTAEAKDRYEIRYYEITTLDDPDTPADETQYAASQTAAADLKGPGTYCAQVYDTETGRACNTFTFTIHPADLKGATVYQVNPDDEKDVSDTSFEYKGTPYAFATSAYNLNLVVNGVVLQPTTDGTDGDYALEHIYVANGPVNDTPTAAGNYVARIVGLGNYANQTIDVPFTIAPLNITTAEIELDTTTATAPKITTINNIPAGPDLKISVTKTPTGVYDNANGHYEYTVEAVDPDDPNLTGSQVVCYDKVAYPNAAAVEYDGAALEGSYEVVYSDPARDDEFDLSKLVVTANGEELEEGQYDIVVSNYATGETVSDASVVTPGVWTVTITVDAAATDYKYAGTFSTIVTVLDGAIESNGVYVVYNGEVTTDITKNYDGTDVMDSLAVVVYDEDGNLLTEGSDYTVEYTNDEDETVTEMIDADSYKITVKGAGYFLAKDEVVNVTINPVTLAYNEYKMANDTVPGTTGTTLAYTGAEITPELVYKDADGKWTVAIPETAYQLEITRTNVDPEAKVDAIVEEGTYEIVVTDNAEDGNYVLGTKTITVTVTADGIYLDTPAGEWYYDYVYAVSNTSKNGYTDDWMSGYAETNIFGPHNNLLRGEAATVLFRMANGKAGEYVESPFDDVNDLTAYYFAPILWAENAGIVTGYTDGPNAGNFCPGNSITREEFCTMLYRYAQVTNQLGDETEADLSAYPDADAVSTWAQDAVEWAAANGIFGGDVTLRPADDISRAEVAKMIYALQLAE